MTRLRFHHIQLNARVLPRYSERRAVASRTSCCGRVIYAARCPLSSQRGARMALVATVYEDRRYGRQNTLRLRQRVIVFCRRLVTARWEMLARYGSDGEVI